MPITNKLHQLKHRHSHRPATLVLGACNWRPETSYPDCESNWPSWLPTHQNWMLFSENHSLTNRQKTSTRKRSWTFNKKNRSSYNSHLLCLHSHCLSWPVVSTILLTWKFPTRLPPSAYQLNKYNEYGKLCGNDKEFNQK